MGARIERNVVTGKGRRSAVWSWGAGILVASSAGTIVRDNLVAWNARGISVRRTRSSERPRASLAP